LHTGWSRLRGEGDMRSRHCMRPSWIGIKRRSWWRRVRGRVRGRAEAMEPGCCEGGMKERQLRRWGRQALLERGMAGS
jgi:hypothetical protein